LLLVDVHCKRKRNYYLVYFETITGYLLKLELKFLSPKKQIADWNWTTGCQLDPMKKWLHWIKPHKYDCISFQETIPFEHFWVWSF